MQDLDIIGLCGLWETKDMLHCQWLEREYDRSIKSGFFMDFFYKKVAEVFVRNVFISGAYVLGEKYIIEHVTKNTGDRLIQLISCTYAKVTDRTNYTIFFFVLTSLYVTGFVLLVYAL